MSLKERSLVKSYDGVSDSLDRFFKSKGERPVNRKNVKFVVKCVGCEKEKRVIKNGRCRECFNSYKHSYESQVSRDPWKDEESIRRAWL